MSIDAGRFTWFEHLSNDPSAAGRFYAEVLPWTIETMPMPGMSYPMIKAGEAAVGGLATLPKGVTTPHWISYVSVEDVEATARKVTANGGKALMDAFEIPTIGRMQPVADPQGGALLLFRSVNDDRPASKGPGTMHWNELWCGDAKAALGFYSTVFGYAHSSMEMGGSTYYVLENEGKPRGGIMQSPVAGIPTHWLPYVSVTDLDATVARVGRNGGKAEGDAIEVPGVGRFAFVRDPQGARLGLITPASAT